MNLKSSSKHSNLGPFTGTCRRDIFLIHNARSSSSKMKFRAIFTEVSQMHEERFLNLVI